MTVTDILFTILFLVGLALACFMIFPPRRGAGIKENTEIKTMEMLKAETTAMLSEYAGDDTGNAIAEAIRKAPCHKGSAEVVKTLIFDWLRGSRIVSPAQLKEIIYANGTYEGFETLLYIYGVSKNGKGFLKCWNEVLKEHLADFKIPNDVLTSDDELKVLTNILFAGTVGLGVIDSLYREEEGIEEIQLGLSGRNTESYDFRDELKRRSGIPITDDYSRNSVHVLIEGKAYRLPFLSPGSEEEMIRILTNLIKDSGQKELTKRNPGIITETEDGRRITVSRPPLSESWTGFIRKFNTVSKTDINELVPDVDCRKILQSVLKEKKSIAVTGEMASGKTTLLRALLTNIGDEKSIRVVEVNSFELNLRDYMPLNNILSLRVSEETPADEVLSFTKKTTGQVFVVGEITSKELCVMLTDISKTASQVFFTAHYTSTQDMIEDFKNAILNRRGISDENAARHEAIMTLGTDIHLKNTEKGRCIEYINEVEKDGTVKTLWPLQADS